MKTRTPALRLPLLFVSVTASLAVVANVSSAADVVEFLSGAQLECTVTAIDKTAREISIEATIAGRSVERTYSYNKIHAVVYRGKRYVINEMASGAGSVDAAGPDPPARSRREVERLINTAGKSLPDWYDDTPLDFPETLDLSWPVPPPQKAWRNQVNVGQYLWDIINPNPGRWRSGVRLMYHVLERPQTSQETRVRCMRTLGGMYFNFFQDYARAAHWWRQGGITANEPQSVALAECYYRLGNKKMAEDALSSRLLFPAMVKLFGDMGETRKALQVADTYVRVGGEPLQVYLLAGDAARKAEQYQTALKYYRHVLDAAPPENEAPA
jgi:hypothetical protein